MTPLISDDAVCLPVSSVDSEVGYFERHCRRINLSWAFYVGFLTFFCARFSVLTSKSVFSLFCMVVYVHTHAWWSESFSLSEVHGSFLAILVQKLSKSVKVCKKCCKKFIPVLPRFNGTMVYFEAVRDCLVTHAHNPKRRRARVAGVAQ